MHFFVGFQPLLPGNIYGVVFLTHLAPGQFGTAALARALKVDKDLHVRPKNLTPPTTMEAHYTTIHTYYLIRMHTYPILFTCIYIYILFFLIFLDMLIYIIYVLYVYLDTILPQPIIFQNGSFQYDRFLYMHGYVHYILPLSHGEFTWVNHGHPPKDEQFPPWKLTGPPQKRKGSFFSTLPSGFQERVLGCSRKFVKG